MSDSNNKRTILICRGSGCNSLEAEERHNELIKLLKEYELTDRVEIKLTGCQGFCQFGPQIIIQPENVLYVRLKEKDLREML